MVELLLSIGADLNVKAEDGRTALHWTASEWFHAGGEMGTGPSRVTKARLLLEHGTGLNIVDDKNTTPMGYAEGRESMFQLFLEYGASKSLPRRPDSEVVSTAL